MHRGRVAAICVTLVDEGEILLVRRGKSRFWSLPGDYLGREEDIHDATLRVMKQQTGYAVHFGGLVDLSTTVPGTLSVNVGARLVYPRSAPVPGGPVTSAAWHPTVPRNALPRHRDRIKRAIPITS